MLLFLIYVWKKSLNVANIFRSLWANTDAPTWKWCKTLSGAYFWQPAHRKHAFSEESTLCIYTPHMKYRHKCSLSRCCPRRCNSVFVTRWPQGVLGSQRDYYAMIWQSNEGPRSSFSGNWKPCHLIASNWTRTKLRWLGLCNPLPSMFSACRPCAQQRWEKRVKWSVRDMITKRETTDLTAKVINNGSVFVN